MLTPARLCRKIAENAGIPLVFVNMLPANMDTFPEKQAWVGSDEEQAGELQATEICKLQVVRATPLS